MSNEELQDLKTNLAVLNERVERWMEQTSEYRKALCSKLDDITEKVTQLPCKERASIYASVKSQIRMVWGGMAIILAAIVGAIWEWIKNK